MNWRLASRLSVITLAILVAVIVAVISTKADQQSSNPNTQVDSSGLLGTSLGSSPAPDFHLVDQNGKQVSLSQFKGEPVILTFLYTHCPDVCPLLASKLHQVELNLGSSAQHVAIVAVSVDPKGDTPTTVNAFSKAHGLLGYSNWHYLMGTEAQLSPVWSSYSVYSAPQAAQTNSVNHTTIIFIIDKQGHERTYFDSSVTPAQMTTDMQILLKQ
ncbi:MAG TPA: SCO family protein [Ktedonobacteraceae bacterium]|nr:SCO family protein [Ktedonobacteraceae bacterium]